MEWRDGSMWLDDWSGSLKVCGSVTGALKVCGSISGMDRWKYAVGGGGGGEI